MDPVSSTQLAIRLRSETVKSRSGQVQHQNRSVAFVPSTRIAVRLRSGTVKSRSGQVEHKKRSTMDPVPGTQLAMRPRSENVRSGSGPVEHEKKTVEDTTKTPKPSLIRVRVVGESFWGPRRVLIALDCGATFIKAGAWAGNQYNGETRPASIDHLETIQWPYGHSIARAQAAIKRVDDMLIFRNDVELALQNGEITAADRMFFDRFDMEDQLSACGESVSARNIPWFDLYSGLLAWQWRAAAKYVSERYWDLKWRSFTKFTQEENFPPDGHEVKVALLIPSRSLSNVRHRQFMVAAANAAGIPNLRLVSEAAARLAHHITKCLQTVRPEDLVGKTLMLLDCGADSVDIEVWTVLNVDR
ncbi:hypothetical protein A1O7_04700 [Cladophialophora yegresii CBS 114405]|uniref:Uncharacterized protein n=1 Tax=Cladophialophora yegresii CBS 114405 TaxID=1182544 RepID=W9VXH6_9EURO|nr:uncharacterized protein A1O7_04700 [Cladophialophora yegresii CBS 114405]EXJ60547.1 hypothetical protein A1O7_04700 [Cladophialophora yegresii CBS 114405]